MRIGVDTGFFLALVEDEPTAKIYWDEIVAEQSDLVLSVLTVHELLVYFYKRGKADLVREWLTLIRALDNVQILPVTEDIAQRAAGYRHGLGIPTVDSLIVATLIIANCELVLSRDQDFERAARQGLITLQLI